MTTRSMATPVPGQTGGRRGAVRWLATGGALLLACLFAGLGAWQVERLGWKLDLIARTDARLAAAPVPAPGRAEWRHITPQADEYRRVTATGRLLAERAARTMAVTEKGPGFWLMVPLVTPRSDTIFVNRGFVPEGWSPTPEAAETVTVTGLMRIPEPGGGFLRHNDPAADLWYSRDVAALAVARGLGPVAPYFIDQDAAENGPGRPVGGLTVVAFHNNHLIYAATWFALALLAASGAWRFARDPSA